jgi:hypothetical protein
LVNASFIVAVYADETTPAHGSAHEVFSKLTLDADAGVALQA